MSVSARISLALATLLATAACACGLAAGAEAAPSSRLPLPLSRSVLALPSTVEGVVPGTCKWTSADEALVCAFNLRDGTVQVGAIRADGSHFACLTCGATLAGEPWKVELFPDGRRFFIGTLPDIDANASSGANITPHVAACAPSILDCERVTVAPVELPEIAGDVNDREPRLSPDGRHYVWTVVRTDGFLLLMGDLLGDAAGYRVENVRVLNPVPNPATAAEWAARNSFNEAKSFDGGDALVFASTRASGRNLDVFSLDLRTGAIARLTRNLEWDEDAQLDPSGHYLMVASSRRMHNQLRASAAVGNPGFLDAALTIGLARASLATDEERSHALEQWLTTPRTERRGRPGEMLNDKRGGWSAAAGAEWAGDGTRAVWTERGPGESTRIVVARFPTLPERTPACERLHGCATPTPEWAPPIDQYPATPAGTYEIPGPGGGSATLDFGGAMFGPLNAISFNGFAGADGRVFNGMLEIAGLAGAQTVDAELDIAGTARGHTSTHVTANGTKVCGTVDTTVDDRSFHANVGQWNPECGFATPRRCPDGADADATPAGDCRHDRWPPAFAAPCPRVNVPVHAQGRIVSVSASIAGETVGFARGDDIRRVGIRRPGAPPERRLRVRLRLTTADGARLRTTARAPGCTAPTTG